MLKSTPTNDPTTTMNNTNQKPMSPSSGTLSPGQFDLRTKGFYWICRKCRQSNSNHMNKCTSCNYSRDPLSSPSSASYSSNRPTSPSSQVNISKLTITTTTTNPRSSTKSNQLLSSNQNNTSRFGQQPNSSSKSNSASLKSRHYPGSSKSSSPNSGPQLSSIGKPSSHNRITSPQWSTGSSTNKNKQLNKSSNPKSPIFSNSFVDNNTANSRTVSRMRPNIQPIVPAELSSTRTNSSAAVKTLSTNNITQITDSLPEEVSRKIKKIIRLSCTPYSNCPPSKSCVKLLSLKHSVDNEVKNYKRLLVTHRNRPFRDEDFVTNRSSLYLLNEDYDEDYDRLIAKWLRIEEIKFEVVNNNNASQQAPERTKSNGIKVQASQAIEMCVRNSSSNFYDFKQGRLGNCWLICSLACLLREHSNMLAQIIPDSHLHNREGIYQVLLCISGKWTPILIDDFFPCDSNGQLVFSQPLGRQLFAPIIEKALAKHHSCYKALAAGSTLEGFSTLTGMPCYQISLKDIKDESDIWKDLWQYLKNDHYLLASSCVSQIDGLLANHAYSLFDMVVIDNYKALLIWNPWADNKLKGRLLLFHQQMSRRTNYKAISGTFWIEYRDFLKYFSHVDICKYQKWKCKRFQFQLPSGQFDCSDSKNFTVFQLTVKKPTRFEMTLYQEVHRDLNFKYRLSLNVVVFRTNDKDGSIRLVECSSRVDSNVSSFSQNLLSGKYLVAVIGFNHWGTTSRLKDAPSLVLCFHGSKMFDVKPINADLHLLGDMLIEMAVSTGPTSQPSSTKELSQQKQYKQYSLRDNKYCFFVTVWENNDPDSYLEVTTDCSSSINAFSTRSEDKTLDFIPPMCRQITILLARECDKEKCSYKYQTEYGNITVANMKWDDTNFHSDVESISILYAPRKINDSISSSDSANRQSICSICV